LPLHRGGDVRLRWQPTTEANVSILWIILIVILVLALLGFFSRGYW
jgi:flagellar basal body-associated protein FliL